MAYILNGTLSNVDRSHPNPRLNAGQSRLHSSIAWFAVSALWGGNCVAFFFYSLCIVWGTHFILQITSPGQQKVDATYVACCEFHAASR